MDINTDHSAPSAGGPEKAVQRRKRLKYMEISEVAANGETVSRQIVAPKGIYKTPHGYRVQLNMGSVGSGSKQKKVVDCDDVDSHVVIPTNADSNNSNPAPTTASLVGSKGKFSRNTKKFEEAVWLYEVAILISDLPSDVQTIVVRGNFSFMTTMRVSLNACLFVCLLLFFMLCDLVVDIGVTVVGGGRGGVHVRLTRSNFLVGPGKSVN